MNLVKLFKRAVRRLKLVGEFKTDKIDNLIITYNPSTDIGGKLYLGESFEKNEITIASRYITKNSTVLDIGANIGIHALNFSSIAYDGIVIAIEPQPKTFRILEKNIIQNEIKNIIPLNMAIAESPKIADFYVMADDAYSSLINTGRKNLTEKIKVLCTSADGLLGDISVDFIKIDVEGLELNVLKSMSNLIEKQHPVIFCEIYKGNIEYNVPLSTINYLRNFGYSAYRSINGALVNFRSNDEHDDAYYNYFFIHEPCTL